MQALILAGGNSSRFYPYSNAGHKSMVKIMGKPILQHTLEGLKEVGIKDVIIRVKPDGIVEGYFGNGGKLGMSIKYIAQEQSLGMGDVLLNAQRFLTGDFIFMAANHVNSKELIEELVRNKSKDSKGTVLVKERENVSDYGVVEIKDGKLVRVVEKPRKGQEPSNLCLVSAFLLPLDIIEVVKKVKMHEFNFEEDVLAFYAKENDLCVAITKQEILTLKYPWDLLAIKNFLMKDMVGKVSADAQVSQSAEIGESVIVESGAQVMEGVKIKGPSYIGKNVKVGTNSLIRDGADLEEDVSVGAFTEIRNSILMEGTTIHSGFIGDSLIGKNCRIGSGLTTANKKIDRSDVEVVVKGEKVSTGLRGFGAIVGNGVILGIKVSLMPGVVVGNNVIVGPATTVFKNVDEGVTYYAKFQEIVEKK